MHAVGDRRTSLDRLGKHFVERYGAVARQVRKMFVAHIEADPGVNFAAGSEHFEICRRRSFDQE
jgi:hypothetical protein